MSLAVPQALQREILAVLVVLFAILTAISLNTPGGSGVFGAWGALLTQIFGWAAWMVPVAIGAVGAMLFVAGMLKIDRLRWEMPLGIGLILAAVVGLLHMSIPKDLKLEAGQTGQAGGMVGYWVSTLFESLAGALGGTVILIALAIIGTIMAFHLSLGDLLRLLGRGGNTMLSLIGTR
ncbi:MAG TPA: DNA translocase FtsK 4TM domain-containing protein, partial [Chloroflexia bacterium]|nr:DNA translocase FtsK 4TM domain-containing protein [Chloroflexia bacterium]